MDKSKEDAKLHVPATGNWTVCAKEGEDSRWFIHESQEWIYNVDDHVYFHVASGTIVKDDRMATMETVEPNDVQNEHSMDLHTHHYGHHSGDHNDEHSFHSDSEVDTEEEEFALDFSRDLMAGTVSRKAQIETKTESEDRFTTCECMSIQHVSNSEALCYYSAVFDGHYGPGCSEYSSLHLKNNILTVFRQSVHSKGVKRRKSLKGVDNAEIADTSRECADVDALVNGCIKGFEMTDNNFCRLADRSGIMDGSTACVLLIYGPDPGGCLKIISANVGDSRAILCSLKDDGGYTATPLTLDHKPDSPSEKERIIASGGSVEFLQGTWRAVGKLRGQIACALATSRSIGDLMLKTPKRIVSAVPDVRIHTVDFDRDIFVALCTDGVTDVITNEEIVNIVAECIKTGNSPEKAAEKIVTTSEQRGSCDDKTCTIIYFGWHKELFAKCYEQSESTPENAPSDQREDDEQEGEEDIFAT